MPLMASRGRRFKSCPRYTVKNQVRGGFRRDPGPPLPVVVDTAATRAGRGSCQEGTMKAFDASRDVPTIGRPLTEAKSEAS
jgi:hypothetical protein